MVPSSSGTDVMVWPPEEAGVTTPSSERMTGTPRPPDTRAWPSERMAGTPRPPEETVARARPSEDAVATARSEPVGFSLGGGFLVVIAATVVASLSFVPAETTARVLIMALAVFGYAACGIRITVSLATAVMAWLFGTGFLVNTAGELGFTGSDLLRLGLLVVAALGGSTCAAMRRAAAGRRPRVSSEVAAAEPGQPGGGETGGDRDQQDQRRHGEFGDRKPGRLRERRDLQDRRAGVQ